MDWKLCSGIMPGLPMDSNQELTFGTVKAASYLLSVFGLAPGRGIQENCRLRLKAFDRSTIRDEYCITG